MLDDLKYIDQLDVSDALGIAEKQYTQLQIQFEIPDLKGDYNNIVVAGMGGSALAAQMSTSWPGYEVPFEVCRNYVIPSYVSSKTLFIASSYSGNTEETVEAMGHAESAGAKIVVIASGGKLMSRAIEKNYPYAKLPVGYQPRHAVLFNFKALMDIMISAGMVEAALVNKEIERSADFLRLAPETWRSTVPTSQNHPKQIALELAGKSPVIYGGPLMYPAVYKWKISFNENAKTVAWCNQIPEFNHNEFMGWTSHPIDKPYGVIDLRSSFEHSRVQKRFEITERMLSGKRPAAIVIDTEGDTILQQLLWVSALGDFVSLYLALLNGLDPTPVYLIEKFKASLDG